MRKISVIAGVIGAVVSMSTIVLANPADQAQTPAQAQTQTQADAQMDQNLTYVKKLSASTTKSGLKLAGDLQITNTCMEAKFVAAASSTQYQAVEFRRPGTDGQACGQIVQYKHVSMEFPDVQASNVIVEAKGYDVSVH
jgi:hypothetical protein